MRIPLTAAACLLAWQVAHTQTHAIASIPITVERNKTILPVSVGRSDSLRLILDTGMAYDGILLFNVDKVDTSVFDHLLRMRIGGAGGGSGSEALSDDSADFSVGVVNVANQRVTILTGNALKDFPTDGVIGYTLFGHYSVEIDFDIGVMHLYEPGSWIPGEDWQSIPLYFKDNRIPWIDITVVTGTEAPITLAAYIDCASGEALELLERKDNRFVKPAGTKKKYLGRGLSGDIYGEEGTISKVSLGTHTLDTVVASFTPAEIRSRQREADAVVGNKILRRFNVVFDYEQMRLYLKPNSRFHEPF